MNCFIPCSFLQIFLFEHFWGHSTSVHLSQKRRKYPSPFSSPNIVPRNVRWIDHRITSDLRLYIDNFSCFTALPYTIIPEGGSLPRLYKRDFRYFSNVRELASSSLSWFIFLRAAELPYLVEDDVFGTVLYSPHRVMRQFGFDQNRPFGRSCQRDCESALLNFVPTSSSFAWEFPKPSTAPYDPLHFVIPEDSRQGRYTTFERSSTLKYGRMIL